MTYRVLKKIKIALQGVTCKCDAQTVKHSWIIFKHCLYKNGIK